MVSHLETGSDSPIGSDRESGRDIRKIHTDKNTADMMPKIITEEKPT